VNKKVLLIAAGALVVVVLVGVIAVPILKQNQVGQNIVEATQYELKQNQVKQDIVEATQYQYSDKDYTIRQVGRGEMLPAQKEQGMDELWCFYFGVPATFEGTLFKASAFAYRIGNLWRIVPAHEDDWLKYSCSEEYHSSKLLMDYLMENE
jgi:hypothetical protein